MSTVKRILVPTDFTERSNRALQEALGIAKQSNAEVHLLHVVDDTLFQSVALEGVCDTIIDKIKQVNFRNAEIRMERSVKAADDTGKIKVFSEIRNGIPAETILREAEEKSIDLIVIGDRMQTDLMRPATGNTTEKIAKKATCRVSVIPRSSHDDPSSAFRQLSPTEK